MCWTPSTYLKRGADLSIDHHRMVSWIRWQGRKPDRAGRLKRVVRVCWERLAEYPVKMVLNSHLWRNVNHTMEVAGSLESEWAMFCATIVEAAAQSCGSKVTGASHGGNSRTCWRTLEMKGAVKLEKETYRS